MKVAMIARNTLYSSPGGDTVQILLTAEYLKTYGVIVDVVLSGDDTEICNYDLLHFFNIIRPNDILPYIQKKEIPFLVSTIFVDYSEYEKRNRTGFLKIITKIFNGDRIEYLKTLARFIRNGDKSLTFTYLFKGHREAIRLIAKEAKMLLPNSHNEYDRFENLYGITCKYKKITNAIDVRTFGQSIVPNPKYKDHILCVGRIEGRKNQLNLIKALQNTDLKLTIIGKPSPNHMNYFFECKRLIGTNPNFSFIEHISHVELASIYKAAKVHVLPSWFETTGLSSLEAGVMDCNVVITDKGDTKEYFGDMAYYCEPSHVLSIREAVLRAYRDPVSPKLKQHILKNYTWDKAAEQTLKAYKEVLDKKVS